MMKCKYCNGTGVSHGVWCAHCNKTGVASDVLEEAVMDDIGRGNERPSLFTFTLKDESPTQVDLAVLPVTSVHLDNISIAMNDEIIITQHMDDEDDALVILTIAQAEAAIAILRAFVAVAKAKDGE